MHKILVTRSRLESGIDHTITNYVSMMITLTQHKQLSLKFKGNIWYTQSLNQKGLNLNLV